MAGCGEVKKKHQTQKGANFENIPMASDPDWLFLFFILIDKEFQQRQTWWGQKFPLSSFFCNIFLLRHLNDWLYKNDYRELQRNMEINQIQNGGKKLIERKKDR